MAIKIAGTGSYTPSRVLTNFDLEKMVETSDQWISERTGIKERRLAAPGEPTSELALKASLRAVEMAGIKPADIDVIIVATITPDKIFPSTACILQTKLGASNAFCFDLEAACSGLLYSLEVAFSMMKSHSKYKTFLVIGAEKLSHLVDWKDRSTCVLFGDGASAVVLRKTEDGDDSIIDSILCSNGAYGDILHVPAGGTALPTSPETLEQRLHYLKMGGQEVFKLAVTGMVDTCKTVLRNNAVEPSAVRWLVPHQANLRILKAVASRVDISEDHVFVNVDRYGNTSAASIGIALDEMNRGGKIKSGDYILLTAFGGGLTWGSMLLRW
jgi:3-oxoacyl-[acyl-carrier-protein] synthase-3